MDLKRNYWFEECLREENFGHVGFRIDNPDHVEWVEFIEHIFCPHSYGKFHVKCRPSVLTCVVSYVWQANMPMHISYVQGILAWKPDSKKSFSVIGLSYGEWLTWRIYNTHISSCVGVFANINWPSWWHILTDRLFVSTHVRDCLM